METKKMRKRFQEKHELTDQDWIDLKRYENMRKSGKNMFHYLANMQKHKNGKRLAKLIMSNGFYKEFLETLEAEANANIYYDSYSAQYLVNELESLGYCLIAARQGYKTLSSPMQLLEAHLKNKTLVYQNNPVTRWCLSNVELEQDRNGNMMPSKRTDKRTRKIDGFSVILNTYIGVEKNLNYVQSKDQTEYQVGYEKIETEKEETKEEEVI